MTARQSSNAAYRIEEDDLPEPLTLLREHVNGWIAQIEASDDVDGKWHVVAYPTEGDAPELPVKAYVLGQHEAQQRADALVHDHAPHHCRECGPWRRSDEQRLSVA